MPQKARHPELLFTHWWKQPKQMGSIHMYTCSGFWKSFPIWAVIPAKMTWRPSCPGSQQSKLPVPLQLLLKLPGISDGILVPLFDGRLLSAYARTCAVIKVIYRQCIALWLLRDRFLYMKNRCIYRIICMSAGFTSCAAKSFSRQWQHQPRLNKSRGGEGRLAGK